MGAVAAVTISEIFDDPLIYLAVNQENEDFNVVIRSIKNE